MVKKMTKNQAFKKMMTHNSNYAKTFNRLLTYDPRLTADENGDLIGLKGQGLRQFIRRYDLNFKPSPKRRRWGYTRKTYADIVKNWNPEESIDQNAERLGLSRSYAYQLRAKLGLPYIKVTKLGKSKILGREVSDFALKVAHLREGGLTHEEIGKIFGLTRQRIEQVCQNKPCILEAGK